MGDEDPIPPYFPAIPFLPGAGPAYAVLELYWEPLEKAQKVIESAIDEVRDFQESVPLAQASLGHADKAGFLATQHSLAKKVYVETLLGCRDELNGFLEGFAGLRKVIENHEGDAEAKLGSMSKAVEIMWKSANNDGQGSNT